MRSLSKVRLRNYEPAGADKKVHTYERKRVKIVKFDPHYVSGIENAAG